MTKRQVFAIIIALALLVAKIATSLLPDALIQDLPYILRDFAIVVIADIKDGAPAPFSADISYEYTPINKIPTNSIWLYEMVEEIIPYLDYEDVTFNPRFPVEMGIKSYSNGESSLHVGGWALTKSRKLYISEWWIERDDLREVLGTVIHEFIHCQGEVFAGAELDLEKAREVEAHTVAATVEVLAGMCLRGNEAACQAFWLDIGDMANSSFRMRMEKHKLGWLSEFLLNVFVRNRAEERAAEKSLRHFEFDPLTRKRILDDYGLYPWETYVIPGIFGERMRVYEEHEWWYYYGFYNQPQSMAFDDSEVMFGWAKQILKIGRKED